MLTQAMQALGHASEIDQIMSDYGLFITNGLCPMASDPTLAQSYLPYTFGFHQIVNGLGGVWDSAAAQWFDPPGSIYQNPPMGWQLPAYWQTWPGMTGLVNRHQGSFFSEIVNMQAPPTVRVIQEVK